MFCCFFVFLIGFCSAPTYGYLVVEFPKSELTERPSSLISVETKLATVIGYKQEVRNRTINVFYGLPYGESPTGKLRFKKSKLVTKLSQDPYPALSFKPHCYLPKAKFNSKDKFSEDCLYLNVWTPNLEQNKVNGVCQRKYAVILWVFGFDNSIYRMSPFSKWNETHQLYNPELIATFDTIFIMFNYRQRLFSSLYLDDVYPANLALFDQNLALQWTREYIDQFCGDTQRITMNGHSFGGYTVQLHLISKHSNKLINAAIVQSSPGFFKDFGPVTRKEMIVGSFLVIDDLGCFNSNDGRVAENADTLDEAIKSMYFEFLDGGYRLKRDLFVEAIKSNSINSRPVMHAEPNQLDLDDYLDDDLVTLIKFLSKHAVDLRCLENVPAERIISMHVNMRLLLYYDDDFIDRSAFLNYKLYNRLDLNPNLRLLIGTLKNEECNSIYWFNNRYYTDQFNAPVIPKGDAKEFIRNFPSPFRDSSLATELAKYYTDESKFELPNGYYEAINNFLTDYNFTCSSHFFANQAALTANSVFTYVITQVPSKHFKIDFLPIDRHVWNWVGRCHADELMWYVSNEPFRSDKLFTDPDRWFALKMVKMWTTFAKNGKMPVQSNGKEWPTADKHHPTPRYVEINHEYTRERKFEFEDRCNHFWRQYMPYYKR